MMQGYRDNPPKEIAGSPVMKLYDYEIQQMKNLKTGEVKK